MELYFTSVTQSSSFWFDLSIVVVLVTVVSLALASSLAGSLANHLLVRFRNLFIFL